LQREKLLPQFKPSIHAARQDDLIEQVALAYPKFATALRGVGVGSVAAALSAASIDLAIDYAWSKSSASTLIVTSWIGEQGNRRIPRCWTKREIGKSP
jgi:hypothetical protein